MKIKSGFIVRQIGDSHMAVPVGERANDMSKLIALTETSAFLWNLLEENQTEAALVNALTAEYEVSGETAAADVHTFITTLREQGWLDE